MRKFEEFFSTINKSLEEALIRQKSEQNVEIEEILKNYNNENRTSFTSFKELDNHLKSRELEHADLFKKLGL